MEKDGAGYAVIMFQKPVDSSNSIIASARFCATATTDVYATFNLGDNTSGQYKYVKIFVFQARSYDRIG
jgi:hypothetical protein